jgi:hypothetical protein
MQIHQIESTLDYEWGLDPESGRVVRRQKAVVRASDSHTISYGGKEYKINTKTGSFEVPNELGQHLLSHGDGWHEGPGTPVMPPPEVLEAIASGKAGKQSDEKKDDEKKDSKTKEVASGTLTFKEDPESKKAS